MTLKVQTDELEKIQATSADNILMQVYSETSFCSLLDNIVNPFCTIGNEHRELENRGRGDGCNHGSGDNGGYRTFK